MKPSSDSPSTIDRAIALADLPRMIRGFGPVKEQAMAAYASKRAELLAPAAPVLAEAA